MAPTPTMTDMYQDANGQWIKTADYRHAPTPADGDDMTWDESTLSKDTALASESSLAKVWANDFDDTPLTYAALVRTVYRLQNEVAGLAAQVVELRERLERWEADS